MNESEQLAYILRVLEVGEDGILGWTFDKTKPMPVDFYVNVNDIFAGAADGENVTPENVEALALAIRDSQAAGASEYASALFVARLIHRRPLGKVMAATHLRSPDMRALFEACGPERTEW